MLIIRALPDNQHCKVRLLLYNVDYPGVTGQTKFDSNGDVDKEFVKVTIEDGKFVKMK